MARDNDYRNTTYCPVLDKVEEQKNDFKKRNKTSVSTDKDNI